MTLWTTPSEYAGFSPVGDTLVLSRTRDSDALTRSNWDAAVERLLAAAKQSRVYAEDQYNAAVYDWRASHWACGWVEYLMVRANAPQAVHDEAAAIEQELADYPSLDDDRWSELEAEEADAYWATCSVRERAEMIRDYAPGVSIFAARRDHVPSNDGRLDEVLRS